MKKWILSSVVLVAISFSIFSQEEERILSEMSIDEQDLVEALVMYPQEIRNSIFEISARPELLIKVDNIHRRSNEEFKEIVSEYSREIEEDIWEISRHPGLIKKLIDLKGKRKSVIREKLRSYPEQVSVVCPRMIKENYDLLLNVYRLDQTTKEAYGGLIRQYDSSVQFAMQNLIDLPEVLTLLNQNIRFTILVGEAYRSNPQDLIKEASELHLEVARKNAQELRSWKTVVKNDQQLSSELKAATEEYQEEYGYDDELYDDIYYDDDRSYSVIHHDHHYPYWFGYPYWYTIPKWRPFAYWTDWGFYWRDGHIVVISLPSFYFTEWYFAYHHHHYLNYSRITNYFVNHYYGPRKIGTSISRSTGKWIRQHEALVGKDFLKEPQFRANRIKEINALEREREQFAATNSDSRFDEAMYLDKNRKAYPEINASRKKVVKTEKNEMKAYEKEWKRVESKSEMKPRIQTDKVDKTPVKINKPEKVRTPRPSKEKMNQVEKAKDYHRQKWDKEIKATQPKAQKITPRQEEKKSSKRIPKPSSS